MAYAALATDYDGTIAHDGVVDAPTRTALERLKAAQRRLILVTGRELTDLERVLPGLDLFDRIVAENGALLFDPATRTRRALAPPPPAAFAERLRARGVSPLSVGEVIVATWEPNETAVLEAIRELGLDLQIVFNKGAVMVLPAGVHKGTGVAAALADLGLSPLDCVGVGDAENDLPLLRACGISVAVGNALPAVKDAAALAVPGARGEGVAQLVDRLLADDLAGDEAHAPAQHVDLLRDADGGAVTTRPRRDVLLLAGVSGGGKSTLTLGLLERLGAGGFQYCVVDPEGDYEGALPAVRFGSPESAPDLSHVVAALRNPANSVQVNLLGVALDHRPAFFRSLLPELLRLRAAASRPHVVVVDEAHHLLPADWDPGEAMLPGCLEGFLFVTVHPDRLAARVLRCVDRVLVVGSRPAETAEPFRALHDLATPDAPDRLPDGRVLTASRDGGWQIAEAIPGQGHRIRHSRKYAEGRLGEDVSFYFRGPEAKLNLRAHNLMLFTQIASGVDLDTWEHHRRAGDYSRWIGGAIKDAALAEQIAGIERGDAPAEDAREAVRRAIEARYTLPA